MLVVIDTDTNPARRRRRAWGRNLTQVLETNERIGRTPATAKQLHHALVEAGCNVSLQAVYLWLAGDTAPTIDNQAAIAKATNVPHHLLYPVEVPV